MTDLLAAFIASTDQVVLEKRGAHFVLRSPATAWFEQLWSSDATQTLLGVSDFLDHFLNDANQHWQQGHTHLLSSGPFIEKLGADDIPLEARASLVNQTQLLILQNLSHSFSNQHELLQAARDNLLTQEALEREVSKRTAELRGRELEIAERLIFAAGFRDEETGAHIRRIGYYSAVIAEAIGWSPLAVDDIKIAAPMHDIGKIGIPDSILKKPGLLNKAEFTIMRTHASIGREMLSDSDVPMLVIASDIAGYHHEYWNGSGYPEGLRGEKIPVAARIVAIVDVYDALVHSRVYKAAFQEEDALSMMNELSGTQFDPELFQVFMEHLDEFREIRNHVVDSDSP